MHKIGLVAAAVLFCSVASAHAETQMWVKGDRATRRTCPSTQCGEVGKLFFRESATVAETKNGWGRVSKYYDASCKSGRSQYVDTGNAECSDANGITNGQFAEWIRLDFLTTNRPADPAEGAVGDSKMVAQSDDFQTYESQFVTAAQALISSGDCTAKDIEDNGGWVKSTNKGQGIYFTYCSGGSDRVYLDVNSGQTYR